jgi:UDP-N-acetylmuramoyl-L-alanyl-D-glutamate--2,6-diaminopimelate ligase
MLQELLHHVSVKTFSGNMSIPVKDLQIDSRKLSPGSCFIAIRGTRADGHEFIEKAIKAGATSVICEKIPADQKSGVTYVEVDNSAVAAAVMSHQFYGRPSDRMKIVGVTGTNGKTTVATLLHRLFRELGYHCGLISTVCNLIDDSQLEATHTTPDPISLNALLARMADAGCTHVFMECSSHAINQHRIDGIKFAGAIFTNISHDHLDYHKTFDEYIRVKKSWFDSMPSDSFAISNADDKRGGVMLQNCSSRKYYYSLRTLADFKGKVLESSMLGLHMLVNEKDVFFKLIGGFNAYNLLAVYGAAVCLGEDKDQVLLIMSNLSGAEGRFDYVVSPREHVVGIIDYAHTPDALLNVLATIRQLRQGMEKIITVVGCGGNRDKAKRPLMAEVACEHSDKVIFTSDNPRDEDPLQILRDMEEGVSMIARKKYITIPDRKEAIKAAVSLSSSDDIILVAGKGHEKYQEVAGVKHEFDDKTVLAEMFGLMEK